MISRSRLSQKSQDSDKIEADIPHLRLDSEPGVDKVGIYVENVYNLNQECFIWRQFDSDKWISEGSALRAGRPSDSQMMSPGRQCFAPNRENGFRRSCSVKKTESY